MTKGPIKNMAASVRQRLLNVAHTTHRRFSDVLFDIALLAETFAFDGAAPCYIFPLYSLNPSNNCLNEVGLNLLKLSSST